MISKIHLANFRNFSEKLISFSPQVTIIVGHNAAGKTNILESIFLLSTGKSFRAKLEEEMVTTESDLARVKGKIGDTKLEAVLTSGPLKQISRKKLLVNGVPKRLVDFAKNFHVVLFAPQDMDLVTEAPSLRRKFLDIVLSQADYEYRRNILSYEKGLRQRNRLLQKIRDENLPRAQLYFWNNLLIKDGNYIQNKRLEFIEFTNTQESFNGKRYELVYDKSAISSERLEQYRDEEIYAGTTLVGPHRDDFMFKEDDRELAAYGSRGEQRMAVLWLKLSELKYIEREIQDKPTLLLDDIFSELDSEHREIVVEVANKQQTIITTADAQFVEHFKEVEKIEL